MCACERLKPIDYKSIALPAELQGHFVTCVIFSLKAQINQCKKNQETVIFSIVKIHQMLH